MTDPPTGRFKRAMRIVWLAVDGDSILGCVIGAGIGFWAVQSHAVEATESTDLYTLAGAAVGVLAVTLAVLALLTGFLTGGTAAEVRNATGGTKGFFRPFKYVAFISGISILASIIGAVNASAYPPPKHTTSDLDGVLFGVAILFFIWGTVGSVLLVRTVLDYGSIRADVEADLYLEDEERKKREAAERRDGQGSGPDSNGGSRPLGAGA